MKSGFLGRLPPISFCTCAHVVIKCNHILISFYGLKSEAEIACKFHVRRFQRLDIPYCMYDVQDVPSTGDMQIEQTAMLFNFHVTCHMPVVTYRHVCRNARKQKKPYKNAFAACDAR